MVWKGWDYPAAKQATMPAMRVENCIFAAGRIFLLPRKMVLSVWMRCRRNSCMFLICGEDHGIYPNPTPDSKSISIIALACDGL